MSLLPAMGCRCQSCLFFPLWAGRPQVSVSSLHGLLDDQRRVVLRLAYLLFLPATNAIMRVRVSLGA